QMMSWLKGEFSLDPTITPEKRVINKALDGLILDSLRMLDEANRDEGELSFSMEMDGFGEDQGASQDEFFDLGGFEEDPESTSSKEGLISKEFHIDNTNTTEK
ncbi:MAG: hypothetical protein AAGJ35_09015, partial [Myxococcota bacterium]